MEDRQIQIMLKLISSLLVRYRELVMYGVFGVLTTIVNFLAYNFCMMVLKGGLANVLSVVAAWLVSVLFAYITNRRWVFESRAETADARIRECGSFFASRAFSGLADLAIMYVAVDLFHYNGSIVKILSNILVIIINYILSKFIVFKKTGT